MTRWTKPLKFWKIRVSWKNQKALALWTWMMSTFHQLWLKNQTVLRFTSPVILPLLCTVHALTTSSRTFMSLVKSNPTTSVSSRPSLRRWDLTGAMTWSTWTLVWLRRTAKNFQHVKETSSFWNQLCKKRSAVPKLKLKRKIQIWKTKKLLPMQLVSVPLNSTTLRLTVVMAMTLIWKQWFPLKVKLDRMCNMPMRVSSPSCVKQTSSQVLMLTTISTMLKAGKLSNCSKTSLA